tara:strand:- start:778 stop:993 length:216 start_codon:yes stop_codon:yes gene_type:complete
MNDTKKVLEVKSFSFGLIIAVGAGIIGSYLIGAGSVLDILIVSGAGVLIGYPIGHVFGNSQFNKHNKKHNS